MKVKCWLLAHEGGHDPYQFRRRLLQHRPDMVNVLDVVAKKGDWGKPMPAGQGRGIAVHQAMGSVVAQVVEVAITPEGTVVDAFADAILALDDSMPTGTYVDMCARLPVVDPEKLTMPTMIMRGEYDGIASFDDLIEFFKKLPHPHKQFSVMPGIAHASFQQKNYMLVYHLLWSFFTQPDPIYGGA